MKKMICYVSAILIIMVFTGCGTAGNGIQSTTTTQKTTAPGAGIAPAPSLYKDGAYDGAADPWTNGLENATVTIKNGKIDGIVLRRLDKNGNEVDYNTFSGQPVGGKTYPNLKKFRVDMANAMVESQTFNVDTISGATVSTANWRVSVQRALDKAKK